MLSKHDKKGPELLHLDDTMLSGVNTLAEQFKTAGDNKNYEFLTLIKTVLSKYPSVVERNNALAAEARELAKALIEFADHTEQLFPAVEAKKLNEIK